MFSFCECRDSFLISPDTRIIGAQYYHHDLFDPDPPRARPLLCRGSGFAIATTRHLRSKRVSGIACSLMSVDRMECSVTCVVDRSLVKVDKGSED